MGVTAAESKIFFHCAYLPCTKSSHAQIKNFFLVLFCREKQLNIFLIKINKTHKRSSQ
jgi:hypothetical protein